MRIQGRWLRRRGLRGRWITVYVHRYGGQESIASLCTSSQPWNTSARPVKRTDGYCRAKRSSAR